MSVKKGDRLVYTGLYASGVPESAKYGSGVVVGFRNKNGYPEDRKVIVVLEDGYVADWPLDKVEPVE